MTEVRVAGTPMEIELIARACLAVQKWVERKRRDE